MQVHKDSPPEDDKKEPEKKLSRAEIRDQERRSREAKEAYTRLVDRFSEFFLNHDNPEGQEVVDRMDQVVAQWQGWCRRLNLTPDARPAMEVALKRIVDQYYRAKKEAKESNVLHEGKE